MDGFAAIVVIPGEGILAIVTLLATVWALVVTMLLILQKRVQPAPEPPVSAAPASSSSATEPDEGAFRPSQVVYVAPKHGQCFHVDRRFTLLNNAVRVQALRSCPQCERKKRV